MARVAGIQFTVKGRFRAPRAQPIQPLAHLVQQHVTRHDRIPILQRRYRPPTSTSAVPGHVGHQQQDADRQRHQDNAAEVGGQSDLLAGALLDLIDLLHQVRGYLWLLDLLALTANQLQAAEHLGQQPHEDVSHPLHDPDQGRQDDADRWPQHCGGAGHHLRRKEQAQERAHHQDADRHHAQREQPIPFEADRALARLCGEHVAQ